MKMPFSKHALREKLDLFRTTQRHGGTGGPDQDETNEELAGRRRATGSQPQVCFRSQQRILNYLRSMKKNHRRPLRRGNIRSVNEPVQH